MIIVRLVAMTAILITSALAVGQSVDVHAKPLSDTDIKLLRQDLQSAKNDIIRDTLHFSSKENDSFWPVYTEYAAAQHALADKRLRLITEYVQNLTTLDDAKASSLTKGLMDIDNQQHELRSTFLPKFEKAIGAKQAAKFYQVDNRLTMMIDIQLASEVPLIP